MFTGIITHVGRVADLQPTGGDVRLTISASVPFMEDVSLGDSICVAGACMTVVAQSAGGFSADVSNESLSLTTLGELKAGSSVNLEKSLTPTTPMGGHFVTGHVDGRGRLLTIDNDGRSWRMEFSIPKQIAHLVAAKGSIAIDGISLTVNTVVGTTASVNIVPHTMEHTTLGGLNVGDSVNIEADLLARYLARMQEASQGTSGISRDFLEKNGFA